MAMHADSTFTFGPDVSKDKLIKNAFNDTINNHDETTDAMLALIKEERRLRKGGNEDEIQFVRFRLLVVISIHAQSF